jgi:hypothetical protein
MPGNIRGSRYRYFAIIYTPGIEERHGVTVAVVAISPDLPGFIALKQNPSWDQVLRMDPEADLALIDQCVEELAEGISCDPDFPRRAGEWENIIRIEPAREFRTSDFEGTFSLIADTEFGSF